MGCTELEGGRKETFCGEQSQENSHLPVPLQRRDIRQGVLYGAFQAGDGRQMIYHERYVETWLSPPFATGIPDHCCGRQRRNAARAGMAALGRRRG